MPNLDMGGKDFELKSAPPCPRCGKRLTGAGSVGHDKPPEEGDVTICMFCAMVLVFYNTPDGLGLRFPNFKDAQELTRNPTALLQLGVLQETARRKVARRAHNN